MRRQILISLFLAALTLAAFWPVLGNGFITYDDDAYVTENRHVRAGLTASGIVWALTESYGSNWIPLASVSHMLDVELFGLNPVGHHMMSLLIHIANTLLLFALLVKMTGYVRRSAFVAALFAVHPLHVESVAWVAERKDVLSALFWMLALLAYVSYARQGGKGRYPLVALALTMGLMSKPMVVTLPLALLLLDYWPLERLKEWRTTGRRMVREKLPLFAISAVFAAITVLTNRKAGALGAAETIPLSTRLGNAPASAVAYMGKLLWPKDLAIVYPLPLQGVPILRTVLSAAVLVIITVLVVRFARNRQYLPFGWLWYLVTLAPVIGLVQVGVPVTMADRFTYIPSIGLFLLLAWAVPDAMGRYAKTVFVPACLAILGCAVCTWFQAGLWRDSETLFRHALASTSDNYVMHNNLGSTLAADGRLDEAVLHYKQALRIKPDSAEVHANYGTALLAKNDLAEAVRHFREAMLHRPDLASAHNGLGIALARLGRDREAIAEYQETLRIDPNYAEAHVNIGAVMARQARWSAAESHFRKAISIRPDLGGAHAQLAQALMAQGRLREAEESLREAARLKPGDAGIQRSLGNLLARLGEAERAVACYRKSLELEPGNPQAANNLAWILATSPNPRLRNGSEAVKLAERASRRAGPDLPSFLDTLAAAYAEAGRFAEAQNAARRALALSRKDPRLAAEIKKRLMLFDAGLPYRDRQTVGGSDG